MPSLYPAHTGIADNLVWGDTALSQMDGTDAQALGTDALGPVMTAATQGADQLIVSPEGNLSSTNGNPTLGGYQVASGLPTDPGGPEFFSGMMNASGPGSLQNAITGSSGFQNPVDAFKSPINQELVTALLLGILGIALVTLGANGLLKS